MDEGSPWIALLVTVLLVAVNGMLASAEIALVGLSEPKLKQEAETGDRKAKLLLRMKQNPSDFLSTIQIGITLAGLLSGAFAADSLAAPITAWAAGMGVQGFALTLVHTFAVILMTLLLTYFMLVFGELVPKRVAMARPEKTAKGVIGLIGGLAKVTKPLVRLLAASTNGVLRLLGIDPNQQNDPVTEEEILLMIEEGHQQGTIQGSEVEFVANLFAFTDLCVEDAMTHRTEMVALPEDGTLLNLVELMSKTTHTKFPVYRESLDKIVGIVYSQDLVARFPLGADRSSWPQLKDLMRPPFFVPESALLIELFTEMKKSKRHMAVVVDEYGGTSGLITLLDILEELVGDIEVTYLDEIQMLEDGSCIIDGRIDMEDAAAYLRLGEEATRYDTLSGFIIGQLGRVPSPGEPVNLIYAGYRMEVLQMEGPLIRLVQVVPWAGTGTAPLP